MPDINTLRARYFVAAVDANPATEPVPQEFQDSLITPLVDAAEYNTQLEAALGLVGLGADEAANSGDFILIANWWLGLVGGEYVPIDGIISSGGPAVRFGTARDLGPYFLDGPIDPGPPPSGGTKNLGAILKAKARLGVDVRVLGWISFAVIDSAIAQLSGAGSIARVNALTMRSIQDLRDEPKIGAKAMLNVISHTAGAVHTKLAIVGRPGEVIGFTGGIDFETQRFARSNHPPNHIWHDVAAKVEGPAVQGLYDWFKDMWAENISRPVRRFKFDGREMPSFLPRTPVLPARVLPLTARGAHRVQSLRTVPAFNYHWYNCLPENRSVTFAQQGLFEVRTALKKALRNAETYIYIEDQSLWGQEILSWAREAIQNHPNLRVILLSAGAGDPNDPATPAAYLHNSINHGLLEGLNAAQITRCGLFLRESVFVHAKVTIVDDQWAMIGSANNMRRSLYSDLEHSVSFLDPAETAVKEFRKRLWADHFRHGTPADFEDIQASLHSWNPSWGVSGAAPARPASIRSVSLPLSPEQPLTGQALTRYNMYMDVDSRQDWGGLCP